MHSNGGDDGGGGTGEIQRSGDGQLLLPLLPMSRRPVDSVS